MVHVSIHSLTGTYQNLAQLGAKGVQLFYVISAFTLFLSSRNIGNKQNANLNFFIRRIFRIAPMYYLAVIYYSIVMQILVRQPIAIEGVILNLTFLHGFSPKYINSIVPGGWSIAIEMLFYLFVPILTKKINNLNQAMSFFIITLVIKIFFTMWFVHNPYNFPANSWTNFLYWYLPNQLPVFSLGIIFFFLVSTDNVIDIFRNNAVFLICFFLTILTLFFLDRWKLKVNLFNPDFFFGIAFLIVGYSLSKRSYKLIVNKFTEFIGQLSFSMYLIHFAVIYWLSYFDIIHIDKPGNMIHFIGSYLIVLFGTVCLSYVSYKFIELKAQEVGRQIINRIKLAKPAEEKQPLKF
jgi:peptidoglycan/LPS O-acetylase OafA/YrhL